MKFPLRMFIQINTLHNLCSHAMCRLVSWEGNQHVSSSQTTLKWRIVDDFLVNVFPSCSKVSVIGSTTILLLTDRVFPAHLLKFANPTLFFFLILAILTLVVVSSTIFPVNSSSSVAFLASLFVVCDLSLLLFLPLRESLDEECPTSFLSPLSLHQYVSSSSFWKPNAHLVPHSRLCRLIRQFRP